jgi:hypothetical protein
MAETYRQLKSTVAPSAKLLCFSFPCLLFVGSLDHLLPLGAEEAPANGVNASGYEFARCHT